jgi:hypothetical protein
MFGSHVAEKLLDGLSTQLEAADETEREAVEEVSAPASLSHRMCARGLAHRQQLSELTRQSPAVAHVPKHQVFWVSIHIKIVLNLDLILGHVSDAALSSSKPVWGNLTTQSNRSMG